MVFAPIVQAVSMHANELDPSPELVRELLATQHPRLLTGPVRRIASQGTVNAIFRVGDEFACRLPLVPVEPDAALADRAVEVAAAERFATVDLKTPEFIAYGEPTASYPMPWSVWRWIDGEVADDARLAESPAFATQLACFVEQVHDLQTGGATFRGTGRGGRLADSDEWVEKCLRRSEGLIDTGALAAHWSTWRDLVRDPRHDTWTHNDLMPGNLLVRDGQLVGVIDVGQAGVADPAVDLQPAWNLFSPKARRAFRDALSVDDERWERGRAWSFIQAIGCLWYYRETNPPMAATAYKTLIALLGESVTN